MNSVLIIIQARLGSTRFKKKVILPITKYPSIVYQYKRIEKIINYAKIVVAIPNNENNAELKNILKQHEIEYFEGSENNVFKRFYDCANIFNPKFVVRLNGDCPLISCSTIDECINAIYKTNVDYISTILNNNFPLGEHVEVFTMKALKRAHKMKLNEKEIEHVTPIFYKEKSTFKCEAIRKIHIFPKDLRLCIDYPEDYDLICKIADYFFPKIDYDLLDIIKLLNNRSELMNINSKFKKSRRI